jgi:hypothetical protein
MASFDIVNYSLRPSKNIQRQIVFDGIRVLQNHLSLSQLVYVGFGSIWFADFIMGHKLLRIDDMISIEANEVGYRRALFNAPYATVRVCKGVSSEILPTLFEDKDLSSRPWMIWLDYDSQFDETLRDDARSVIERSPVDSILLITFDGKERKYGQANDRPALIKQLFGAIVPDNLSKDDCRDDRLQQTLADFAIEFMKSVAADLRRPGGFLPAFRLIYKDTAPMITVGGLLPARGAVSAAMRVLNDPNWECRPTKPIIAPHLTIREAAALQSQLPRKDKLSREIVRSLGFDLDDAQIEAFEAYYLQYPAFAQIIA